MMRLPKNDIEFSRHRLDLILGRRRLNFNPYAVSDRRLLEIVDSVGWGNEYDIAQMVKLQFTRLHEVCDYRRFTGIYAKVGSMEEEIYLPAPFLKFGVTAFDTLRPEYSMLGKHRIRHDDDIEMLVGRTVFVSHLIRGHTRIGESNVAYRMHRLTGNEKRDAQTIRRGMCEAKIYMLERIRDYQECFCYFDCSRDMFDVSSRINETIESIRCFSDTIPPIN